MNVTKSNQKISNEEKTHHEKVVVCFVRAHHRLDDPHGLRLTRYSRRD
jgi:hypothetical protein